MNPWERQDALARTTSIWAASSIGAGLIMMARRDRWWRSFGQQHLGWGVVDLGIITVVQTLQRRRMSQTDPLAPAVLERERKKLRVILGANAAADVGYVVGGWALWKRASSNPRASGAGAAIVIQGTFLALHDAYHAWQSGPDQPVVTPRVR